MDNAMHSLGSRGIDLSADPGQAFDQAPAGAGANLFALVHRRLRGRYHWVALAAAALAVPGAIAGYHAKKPQFTSTGIIRVAPTLPPTLYNTPENQLPPLYTAMVQSQAEYVQSRNVLDKATENPKLTEVGWPVGPEGVKQLKRAIGVRWGQGELIQVSATHADALKAQRALNAVLDSYYAMFGDQSDVSRTETERSLIDRERELSNSIDALRKQVADVSGESGPDGLRSLHQAKISEIDEIERSIAQLDMAIAATEAQLRGGDDAAAAGVDLLAESDLKIATLRQTELALKTEIGRYRGVYGPNHRRMVDLNRQLAAVQQQIAERVRELAGPGGATGDAKSIAVITMLTLAQMRDRAKIFGDRRDFLRSEAATIQSKLRAIASLEEQVSEKRQRLSETTKRLDEIRVESGTRGRATSRITIVQRGDLPVAPEDKRKVLAGFGGLFGAGMGAALVFLLTLLDRGYRYIDDLEKDTLSAPLLGTLPDLTERAPEQDEMAALAVHHLRNMLQLQPVGRDQPSRVYTITSASAGDGKTSLALALGMSFAVSGQKTLLLDADLVGRGLTRELKMERAPGLCQAVSSENLNGEVHESGVANLWTLPAGPPEVEAKHLSHAALERIIRQLRTQFDTILIDTGPILGSLEANLVAALSDGVVIAVARGQSHKFVAACLERLRRMGATCAGLVFNRAQLRDFERSVSAASVCSQSLRPASPEGERSAAGGRAVRGALVRAVIGASAPGGPGAPGGGAGASV